VPGRLPEAICGVWLAGVLVYGARRAAAHRRVARLARRARPTNCRRLLRSFDDRVRAARPRSPVALRIADSIGSPAVFGVLRPVVLLPAAAERWSDADARAVLAHELGHVARADGLTNLVADVARAVYWCNPALAFAVRRLRAESEHACDDRALDGGADAASYARLLVAVARAARSGRALASAASAMARPCTELESRLVSVLDARRRREPLRGSSLAIAATVAAALAAPLAALTLRADAGESAGGALTELPRVAAAPEPDRLGDALARPESERIALAPDAFRLSADARRALDGPDSVLASRLADALDHRPEHSADLVRERAAWALGQSRDGLLVEPLLDALGASDWRVQSNAAWALAVAAEPRAVDRLLPLLEHPVWRLRAMAAYALRAGGDPRAATAMIAALDDPAWQVRVEAVEYLAAASDSDALDLLRPRLDDRHVAVRLAAARALDSR
jgi:beta-lactamase regulating signal transducer with metallopeptidase domain